MRIHAFKFLLPLLIVAGGIGLFSSIHKPATAAPPDTPSKNVEAQSQAAGVTLEKEASHEEVALGQVVTYTVTINNENAEAIDATLTDELLPLPAGLSLQTESVTTTVGTFETADNTLVWSVQVPAGDEVEIIYTAIPPTTSSANETRDNVAVLQFGETTLRDSAAITTLPAEHGIFCGFLAPCIFVNLIARALVFFDVMLEAIRLPYAFGFAIILFTVLVRLATFPLNLQQIKSAKGMQSLQPELKKIQEKHKNDREKLAQEQMRLYKEHGVNPLGGCLPLLVQMPIWISLYIGLLQLSSEGLLTEGFFWIPSLSGPVSSWGGGLGWLWPFPPSIGWANALAYLVMPVLLVVSQISMQKLMTPPATDPQQAQMQKIMQFMPLMFGYFALIVPSGLTLYWFTSNILGVAQHYFTKTQFDQEPAKADASVGSNSPVPASTPTPSPTAMPATSSEEDKKRKNAKSKRKSRRKR